MCRHEVSEQKILIPCYNILVTKCELFFPARYNREKG